MKAFGKWTREKKKQEGTTSRNIERKYRLGKVEACSAIHNSAHCYTCPYDLLCSSVGVYVFTSRDINLVLEYLNKFRGHFMDISLMDTMTKILGDQDLKKHWLKLIYGAYHILLMRGSRTLPSAKLIFVCFEQLHPPPTFAWLCRAIMAHRTSQWLTRYIFESRIKFHQHPLVPKIPEFF